VGFCEAINFCQPQEKSDQVETKLTKLVAMMLIIHMASIVNHDRHTYTHTAQSHTNVTHDFVPSLRCLVVYGPCFKTPAGIYQLHIKCKWNESPERSLAIIILCISPQSNTVMLSGTIKRKFSYLPSLKKICKSLISLFP